MTDSKREWMDDRASDRDRGADVAIPRSPSTFHPGLDYSCVSLPLWPLILATGAAAFWTHRRSLRLPGLCSKCHYDLRGIPPSNGQISCPECGNSVTPRQYHPPLSRTPCARNTANILPRILVAVLVLMLAAEATSFFRWIGCGWSAHGWRSRTGAYSRAGGTPASARAPGSGGTPSKTWMSRCPTVMRVATRRFMEAAT
jgi:hypothetical protein